jgi:hypothetical protein
MRSGIAAVDCFMRLRQFVEVARHCIFHKFLGGPTWLARSSLA